MILYESIIDKVIDYAKNNKGKLLAGAAGLAALGGATYYAKEHFNDSTSNSKPRADSTPGAPRAEEPADHSAPAAANPQSENKTLDSKISSDIKKYGSPSAAISKLAAKALDWRTPTTEKMALHNEIAAIQDKYK